MKRKIKTRINEHTRKTMGLQIKDGEIVDKYGRVMEEFTDDKGYIDIRPTGRVK